MQGNGLKDSRVSLAGGEARRAEQRASLLDRRLKAGRRWVLVVGVSVKRGEKASPRSCAAAWCGERNRRSSPRPAYGLAGQPHVFGCERRRAKVVKDGLPNQPLLSVFS